MPILVSNDDGIDSVGLHVHSMAHHPEVQHEMSNVERSPIALGSSRSSDDVRMVRFHPGNMLLAHN